MAGTQLRPGRTYSVWYGAILRLAKMRVFRQLLICLMLGVLIMMMEHGFKHLLWLKLALRQKLSLHLPRFLVKSSTAYKSKLVREDVIPVLPRNYCCLKF